MRGSEVGEETPHTVIEKQNNNVKSKKGDQLKNKRQKKEVVASPESFVVESENYILSSNSKNVNLSKYTDPECVKLCAKVAISNLVEKNSQFDVNTIDDLVNLMLKVNECIDKVKPIHIECSSCKQIKKYTEFKESSVSSTGRMKMCIECKK
jgi:hypothetical protein